jgi:ABC-type phosphate/phosphonate transport system substrate-binding protein
MGLATPVVTMSLPDRGRSRSAVLVAQPGIRNLTELADRRVGWVSRFSTTGHDLPRLYLESFGVDVDALFRSQRFCGSHAAATAALACGEVDVIATHSGALPRVFEATLARLVVSIGPVPSDVLVAGVGVPAGAREHLVQGLRAAPLGNFEFGRASSGHLDLLESLRRHAFDGGTRTLPGRCATVAARP